MCLFASCSGAALVTKRDNLALARQFVAAVERGSSDEVAALLAEDVLHEEFPNRLMPNGATRDKAAVLAAGERGKKAMTSQRNEILNAVADAEDDCPERESSAAPP
jgi:ketosteroid isomerase-like protein